MRGTWSDLLIEKHEQSHERNELGNALHNEGQTLRKKGETLRKEGQKHLEEELLESKHTQGRRISIEGATGR